MNKKCDFCSKTLGFEIVVFSGILKIGCYCQKINVADLFFLIRPAQGLVSEILDENRHHKSLSPSGGKPWYQVDILFRKWNIVCRRFFEI